MNIKNLLSYLLVALLGALITLFMMPRPLQKLPAGTIPGSSDTVNERKTQWQASAMDRVGARQSLFVQFPGIVAAIQRGGAFGGTFSRTIATDIFATTDAGIADARRLSRIEAMAPRTWMIYLPLVNVVVFETSEGLVVVDTGMSAAGPVVNELIRSVSDRPIHTIIYTHGHVDHAYGTWALMADQPRIIAHEDVTVRFDRYIRLRGSIAKYMGQPVSSLPERASDLIYPTHTFEDDLSLTIGGEIFELRARPGETDDQLYVWVPGRKILATADYYQGFLPNAGNGKRVQRYPQEWADALLEMASEEPDLLLPAHGAALREPALIQENLRILAEALQLVIDHTVAELNKGTRQDLVYRSLEVPDRLLNHPSLKQQYVSWQDISKMVMRRHVGWWDDIPSHWAPASFDAQAAEIGRLAGGVAQLDRRARALLDTDIVMASHLADWAWFAQPGDPMAQKLLIDVYAHRIMNTEATTQEILAYVETMTRARRLQLGHSD